MQGKFTRNSLLILLTLFFAIPLFLDFPAYAAASKTPVPTPTIVATVMSNGSQFDVLEARIQGLETNAQTQSEAYAATVTRMEANMNFLLAVMAVASLLVAVLGFGFVKIWIRQQVEQKIQSALSREVTELAKQEIDRIRGEWDPKFAELYEEYRKTIVRK